MQVSLMSISDVFLAKESSGTLLSRAEKENRSMQAAPEMRDRITISDEGVKVLDTRQAEKLDNDSALAAPANAHTPPSGSVSEKMMEEGRKYAEGIGAHGFGKTAPRSTPAIEKPITHTTSHGNSFTFETVADRDDENTLYLTVTTSAGEEMRFSVDSDIVISENKNGELSINQFEGEGTDSNDIVVSFSSRGGMPRNLKGGDDFLLFIDDEIATDKSGARDYFEATATTQRNIDTGGGDDAVHVVSSTSKGLDDIFISTGDGDDSVNIYTPSTNEKKTQFSIQTGNGNDTVTADTLQGSSLSTGDGDDEIVVNNFNYGRLHTGDGSDKVVVNNFNASRLDTGDGNNKVKIDSSTYSQIDTGNGNDELAIKKAHRSNILTGDGDDRVRIDSSTYSKINTGNGDDELTIEEAHRSKISTGDGDNYLLFESIFESSIRTGDGKNKVTILDKMANVEFDAFDGEVEFYFDPSKATNLEFYHLSEDTARSLLKLLDKSDTVVVAGELEKHNINIGWKLQSESNFKTKVKISDYLLDHPLPPLVNYSPPRD
ncbi:hypothetical protein [Halodesulfovibrio sp.]|uniref:hypothetical protein n=1 Tax=Halodesulfovibrio sp. TaxID=1912772 RepID=UPI0025F21DD7|nr:hypothetical protein [Halodesulfovibrio sp.]MCT4625807.1 hypothetical protein [Halodesulfovibrio sp.]